MTAKAALYADVAVPVPLGQAFTYLVPPELASAVVPGARVVCAFGPRRVLGVVLSVTTTPPAFDLARLKPIGAIVDSEPVLPGELLRFLVELGRYYLAPIGEVMRLALPAVERSAVPDVRALSLLAETGTHAVGGRAVQVVVLVREAERPAKLAAKAAAVLDALATSGKETVAALERNLGSVRGPVKKLTSLGLVRVVLEEQPADPFFAGAPERDVPPDLTAPQAAAVGALRAGLDARRPGAFLLHGVTASGKTEVYLRAVATVLEQGRGAIVLVPEIALTPQLVQRFRARLGDTIAVLHSGLGDRERHAMWRSLRSGKLSVAVGARSALFAPVPDLALVCVDEEHDPSFKQEEGVRYHARDMAMLRAHRAGAICVLGSATPSLGTGYLARTGKVTLLSLPDRAHHAATLPKVEVVDLRRVGPGPSGARLLTLPLHRALERVLERGQQAILFLNRRGFAPSLLCDACGHVAECPNCSVALTLHRSRGARLVCHYCDHHAEPPSRCPECKADRFVEEGAGTERIEALLKESLPAARVARLDRDVAAGLKSEKVIDRMRRGEVDVLIGTQMVTKGHDLPRVTLVGVLNADAALAMPDYQAAERTFQLLVQVAGRAGRAGEPGTVLVQTRHPTHPAIAMAMTHDVAGFTERELRDREELGYPPYSRIALVRIDAVDERVARSEAERLAEVARRASARGSDAAGLEVVGPAAAPIERLRNRHRHRFLVRAPGRPALRLALAAVQAAATDRRTRVVIDVDPVNML